MFKRIPRYDGPGERWGLVTVDTVRCTGCNLCVRACPSDALLLADGKARMRTEGVVQCMACGDCIAICPDGAVALVQSYSFTGAYETLDRGDLELPRM
jgi:2-oxoglutarate ferredoxin oxidoreductase subunit delta